MFDKIKDFLSDKWFVVRNFFIDLYADVVRSAVIITAIAYGLYMLLFFFIGITAEHFEGLLAFVILTGFFALGRMIVKGIIGK